MKTLRGEAFCFNTNCFSVFRNLLALALVARALRFVKLGFFVYIASAGVRSVEFYFLCIFLCAEHGRSPFLGASSSVALSFRFVFILVFLALVTWGPNACGVVAACAMHGASR